MRKAFLSLTTAAFLGLAGCTTTQVTDFLKQVQAVTAATCLFVPTIDTILAVANALGIPYTGIVGGAIDTISHAICSQVPPPASANFKALPRLGGAAVVTGSLNGVPIKGWRAR